MLAITCQPLSLAGQPRALKIGIHLYFFKRKIKNLPQEFFAGPVDVIRKTLYLPLLCRPPQMVQTQYFPFLSISTRPFASLEFEHTSTSIGWRVMAGFMPAEIVNVRIFGT